VMPGMPGGQAGIRPGDVITSVNGSSVAALSFMHALNLIARGAGGQVHLVVLRRGGGGPVRVTLVPRLIPVPVVTATALTYDGRRYEYVRMFSFPNGSAVAVQRAVALAVRNHARGVVLDLRGNPGGLLAQAVAVARLFVGSGPIVTTYGLHEPRQVFSGDGTAVHGLRVAVMVDHATASAAEVVAGSLRHAGAVLVGRRTYGKGTVQSIEPLSNGGGLKLTVARFVLPGDVVIEGRGLRPDVTVRGASRRKWATLLAALRELAG
ncbi:MAG TPA: S41 family peptidase, partial [Gaiellales bacterium]|nr:S41 family peptidase [Gaiellales bacterium]